MYSTLDPQLQDALKKYLVAKGVGESLTNFLILHLHKKEQGQYVNWLQKLESSVAKSEWQPLVGKSYMLHSFSLIPTLSSRSKMCHFLHFELKFLFTEGTFLFGWKFWIMILVTRKQGVMILTSFTVWAQLNWLMVMNDFYPYKIGCIAISVTWYCILQLWWTILSIFINEMLCDLALRASSKLLPQYGFV